MAFASAVKKCIHEKFYETVYDNPVIVKDMRTRMRGAKGFAVIACYLAFISITLLICTSASVFTQVTGNSDSKFGETIFQWLMNIQALLVTFIVPALTSGSVTIELEKHTIGLVALSRLTTGRIILGKQLSVFFYTLVLVICSVPLASIAMMYGGLSPAEIAISYLMLIAWAFLISSIGVFWSSLFNRTITATLMSYVSCGIYAIFSYIVGGSSGHFWMMFIPGQPQTNVMPPFVGLYPAWAPVVAFSHAEIGSMHIPIPIIAITLHLAVGLLLLCTAIMHVKYRRDDMSLPVRILLVSISSIVVMLICSTMIGSLPQSPQAQIINGMVSQLGSSQSSGNLGIGIVGFIALGILSSFVAVFATGPIRDKEANVFRQSLLSWRKIFRGDLRGSIPFMILWSIVLYGFAGIGLKLNSALSGAQGFPNVSPWGNAGPVNQVMNSLSDWTSYAQIGIALVVSVICYSAVGILLSSLFHSRRSAFVLTALYIIVSFSIFPLLYLMSDWIKDTPIWQLCALGPALPMSVACDVTNSLPSFWWAKEDSWLVTSLLNVAMTIIVLGLASLSAGKYGGVKED